MRIGNMRLVSNSFTIVREEKHRLFKLGAFLVKEVGICSPV